MEKEGKKYIMTTDTIVVDARIVDFKINQLLELTDEFIFPALYSPTGKMMWKISNVYTKFKPETLVLCCVDEGIELALDTAIIEIKKRRDEFFGGRS